MKPGTFKKGQSGNPGGRPKVVAEVRDLARQHTEDAIKTLVSIAGDHEAPPAARVSAASTLLDRAWGKPAQAIVGSDDDAPIKTIMEIVWAGSNANG